ncbi:hypothetical protein [Aeromonas sp. OTU364]|uniref:hypothetical protein n=1 Tax=Aeromonas sp. OTU364 TaxID=3043864 RepID=UPI00313D9D8C
MSMNEPSPEFNNQPSVGISEVHTNVTQEVVQITIDKLTLILNEHSLSQDKCSDWKTPLGISITIVIVLLTTDFKTALSIEASAWKAIFIVSLVLCLGWLARSLYNIKDKQSISQVIEKIKNK